MLDAHTRESITVTTKRYLRVLHLCRWSKLVRHQKSALFGSEIRMERLHLVFCTNRHRNDIKQYVREIRNLFSDKESVVFRDLGGNDYRLRPFTVEV